MVERIIIDLSFPMFSSAKNSRFLPFFNKISAKNKENGLSNKKIYKIYPEKIMQNQDKRTSIILNNIPKVWPKNNIRFFIESFGNINFFYIYPGKNKKNTSSVYINFINYKSIVNIFMKLRKRKYQLLNKAFIISIKYSKIQGKQELIKFFGEKSAKSTNL